MNLWPSIPAIALSTSSEIPFGRASGSFCALPRMVSIIAARSRAHCCCCCASCAAASAAAKTAKATVSHLTIIMCASVRRRTSLRLDPGCRHRLGDALLLVLHGACEVRRSAARRLGADLVERGDDLRLLHDHRDL